MNTKKIFTVTLLTLSFLCLSFAEVQPDPQLMLERRSTAKEKSTATRDAAATATPMFPGRAIVLTGNSEVFQGIFIDAGKTVSLDSTLDYSSATSVAIGVQCIVCDSYSTSLGASGLVLVARWTVPDAKSYVATENQATTKFLYWDTGGVIFNVYGSQFRLSLQNKGSEPVAIEQLTLLRRSN